MESHSIWERISAQRRKTFKKWCPLFVIAFLLTLAVHVLFLSQRAVCSAVVHLNYVGIETGFDPNGNRFDPSEMKDASVIRQAAEAMGQTVTDEDVERIQDALEIVGNISDTVFQKVTENTSIFGEDSISELTDVREEAYFPSHYTLKFRYADAGFTVENATPYLSELLTAYETYFYEKYGYHTAFKHSLTSSDYQSYDYIDAVDVLSNHLTTLRTYLTRMEGQDNTRFVSKETGYSFLDLIGTVDTIRNENLQWVTSYIIGNNMTKDRGYLIDYYRYKIEDAERALEQQNSRLSTLNEQIDSYVKTNAVFPMMGSSGSGQDNEITDTFEFAQPSQMYNSLISQKVNCQTSISETQEQIALFNRRIERLQAAESSGNPEMVETQLKTIDDKIQQLLGDIQQTSDEFYKSEWLKNAFQILKEPQSKALSIGLKSTVLDILTVEILMIGLYILSYLPLLRTPKRRTQLVEEDHAMKEQVST